MLATALVHPASLVDPKEHAPALLDILNAKVSRNVISYVVDVVSAAVDQAFARPGPSRGRSTQRTRPSFTSFATRVLANADVPIATVLVTLAYIKRAVPHLHIALEEWACERVFLGALVCAAKYANDSTLRNVHWAACTQVFSAADVGRVEREFLDVLAFELGVSETELLPICAELRPLVHPTKSTRARAAERPATPLEVSMPAPAPAATPAPAPVPEDVVMACPDLAHDSDSDATLSSPTSSPLLTPPSAAVPAAAAPAFPPGLGYPLDPTAGPARAKSERKRPSPLSRLSLKFHFHHHASPASDATPSPEPTHRVKRIVRWI